jgi:arabinose-5-phosphate isomerase
MKNTKDVALKILDAEIAGLVNLKQTIDETLVSAVDLISSTSGKTIICGMGKSGIVGKKIAATLASTGTPSFFLHPGEAYHGDLGMIEPDDVVILISNSGETDEVIKIIPFLQRQGNKIISITSNDKSTLATNSTFHINTYTVHEGCPLNLAPMASTTATLVVGDLLAGCLMSKSNFKDLDFAKYHPGGSLGKRLLGTVKDICCNESLPYVHQSKSITDVIHSISSSVYGLTLVVNNKFKVKGVITDGDIRRVMEEEKEKIFSLDIKSIMSTNFHSINESCKLRDTQIIMNDLQISSILVRKDSSDDSNIILSDILGIAKLFDVVV